LAFAAAADLLALANQTRVDNACVFSSAEGTTHAGSLSNLAVDRELGAER